MAQDRYRYFRIEARELLDQLGKGVLDLEKGAPGAELVSRLLRLAHTLKGAARVVRERETADLAHSVESVLVPYREGGQAVPRERIDAILGTLDAIGGKLAELPAPADAAPAAAGSGADASVRTVRADVAEVDALLEGLREVDGELAAMRRTVGSAGRARHLSALLAQQLAAPHLADRQRTAVALKARSLAEELHGVVVALARGLAGNLERVDRELRQAHDTMERLRLVPAGAMFNGLERAARDAARSLGRRVAFEASGGEVRLDGHVLDVVQGAMVQLVRNAVAHGIEPEAERIAAGKPAQGVVALEVTRRGHRVSFLCKDDGRGVDLAAVRGAAHRKGLHASAAGQLAPEALLRTLLQGGITTSDTVTELSGRGVGLDVVRAAVERLGGEAAADTAAGKGTSIELRVPVSLASLQALLVEADGQVAAIPLDAVRGTIRVAPHEVARSPERDSILHEGKLIPFAPLGSALSGRASAASRKAVSAVIVSGGGRSAALAVDRLVGTESIVLRPLPALAAARAVVAGAHIDSNGDPYLVIDPEVLASGAWADRETAAAAQTPMAALPILVVDDSLTTRMLEQSILESAGYEVALASSAEEGLELARRRRYALFLVDIEMPGMNGFGFIEQARADAALRDVPCMLVTSRDAPEDRRRGADLGVRAYVVKSEFEQVEFLDRVAELAGR